MATVGGRPSIASTSGPLQPFDQLPAGRRHALEKPAPAFGVDRVERQRTLARAAHAGQHDQPIARQVNVNTAQVVHSCARTAIEEGGAGDSLALLMAAFSPDGRAGGKAEGPADQGLAPLGREPEGTVGMRPRIVDEERRGLPEEGGIGYPGAEPHGVAPAAGERMTAMHILDIFEAHPTTFSFEFFPPKTDKASEELFANIAKLQVLQPSFVSVTYGAGGSTRERTHDLIVRIQRETDLTAVSHLTCVCHTREELGGDPGPVCGLGHREHPRPRRRPAPRAPNYDRS